MKADDPRHGTHRGYVVGCREGCCTEAHTRYMKLYRMGRIPRMVSPVGTIRRIEALQAIGWSYADIGRRCNKGHEWARMVSRSKSVTSSTADLLAEVYEEMCMVVPRGRYAARTRGIARRKGYLPPLAWDNIDDLGEQPNAALHNVSEIARQDVDEVVVLRVLAGDTSLSSTASASERAEIAARWAASGRSLADLRRVTGWKPERYWKASA